VVDVVRRFVMQSGRYVAFPVAVAVALVLFLLVQREVDRRDPKLALAPVREDKYVWIPLGPEGAG
jgi:hypothetical protein